MHHSDSTQSNDKDFWDKLQILGELAASLVGGIILVIIPIMIGISGDKIARSFQTGELVDNLITELTEKEATAKRDIALIALDAAVEPKQKCVILGFLNCQIDEDQPDQVAEIAEILIRTQAKETRQLLLASSLDEQAEELSKQREALDASKVSQVLIKRRPEQGKEFLKRLYLTYENIVANDPRLRENVRSDVNSSASPLPEKVNQVQQSSELADGLQTPVSEAATTTEETSNANDDSLAGKGVRLVYIQYGRNRENAQKIQEEIQDSGVSAPGIEQVNDIRENSVRYSSADDLEAAEELKTFLEALNISNVKLIDLSQSNYQIAAGQFEIWLKD